MDTHHNYKDFADLLHLSPRTVKNYTRKISEKKSEKNKLGMVLFGIKKI